MNSDTKKKLMQLCREAIDTNACGYEDEFGAMIEAAFADWELIDTRYHTIIDRRLLERMPVGVASPYAAVCRDGSGFICNGYEPFRGTGELCSFCPGFDTSTAAMQAWLDAKERPAWDWPVPTDADRGKLVYVRDYTTTAWTVRLREFLVVADDWFVCRYSSGMCPTSWHYAVLADPDNPDARPPEDLVPAAGKAAGGNNG